MNPPTRPARRMCRRRPASGAGRRLGG